MWRGLRGALERVRSALDGERHWNVACGDTAPIIPEHHHLWRRFIDDPNHVTWDGDQPLFRPLSMRIAQGEDGLSCAWAEHLNQDRCKPGALLEGNEKYTLVGEVPVRSVGMLEMPVLHDPKGSDPVACAHSLVKWPPGSFAYPSTRPDKPERNRLLLELSRSFSLVHGKVMSSTPPGS
jgi:hypothetical protein